MTLFTGLYNRVLELARHRHANYWLGSLSFAESSFFPVPPDVMLAPMVLARPKSAWRLALLTTVASVVGGMAGYAIGYFAFSWVEPWIIEFGYQPVLERAQALFREWGVWIVLTAGFTPIPYKIFTIASGVAAMAFLPFLLASVVGRGCRFFLVAGLVYIGGPKLEPMLRQYMEHIGWAIVVLVTLFIVYSTVVNG